MLFQTEAERILLLMSPNIIPLIKRLQRILTQHTAHFHCSVLREEVFTLVTLAKEPEGTWLRDFSYSICSSECPLDTLHPEMKSHCLLLNLVRPWRHIVHKISQEQRCCLTCMSELEKVRPVRWSPLSSFLEHSPHLERSQPHGEVILKAFGQQTQLSWP